MKITRKTALGSIATLGAASLLVACSAAPEEAESTTEATTDIKPCMVSDQGGFDDKSFNQLSFEGLQAAADELGVEPATVQSQSESDFAGNLESLVGQGCTLIVSVGFALAEATAASAEANPDIEYAIVDDSSIDADNVKPIVYDAAQAAFLAGYAAAAVSETGVVGTFGGQPFPTVTIFMDGFAEGVEYYNQEEGGDVQVVGWDVDSQEGSFTGGFEANPAAKSTAEGLIALGADVLLPVGGPIYQSAAEAISDSGKSIALIGADADLYETDPQYADMYLTSVLKGMSTSVEQVVLEAAEGNFSSDAYVGTLENEGVGIAPFHDWESKLPDGLQDKLDTISAAIVAGDIEVSSEASPE